MRRNLSRHALALLVALPLLTGARAEEAPAITIDEDGTINLTGEVRINGGAVVVKRDGSVSIGNGRITIDEDGALAVNDGQVKRVEVQPGGMLYLRAPNGKEAVAVNDSNDVWISEGRAKVGANGTINLLNDRFGIDANTNITTYQNEARGAGIQIREDGEIRLFQKAGGRIPLKVTPDGEVNVLDHPVVIGVVLKREVGACYGTGDGKCRQNNEAYCEKGNLSIAYQADCGFTGGFIASAGATRSPGSAGGHCHLYMCYSASAVTSGK